MIVFQIIPSENKKMKGEIDYWFALTQPISLENKINLLFSSKKLSEFSSDELIDKCDTAEKMGLNTKEIYL